MTSGFESYFKSVVEEIHKTHDQGLWVHLNREQHPDLEGYPVNRVDSVPVFVSDDVLGEVREEASDQDEVTVEVIGCGSGEKDDRLLEKVDPPTTPKTKGARCIDGR